MRPPYRYEPCGYAGRFFFSSRRRHTRFDCDWSSDVCSSDLRKALRPGGTVVAYGLTSAVQGKRPSDRVRRRRHRIRPIAVFGLYIAGGWVLPGRKRVIPYSIQWLKRLRPALFREDLLTLFELLRQHKIQPLVTRLPFVDARRAHELLAGGGVTGKIVLVPVNKFASPAEHPAAHSA